MGYRIPGHEKSIDDEGSRRVEDENASCCKRKSGVLLDWS